MRKSLVVSLALSVLSLVPLVSHAHLSNPVPEKGHARSPIHMNTLARISLGGLEQWILTQGKDELNPVLLFLHGGPGIPIIPFVSDFDAQAKLQEHFVMVYWDQRGAGKSYHADIPVESMNIEQFLTDTYELIEILRKRFQVPKIYLVGHSWGSIIGALTAARHPELFYAYVGIGQVVNLKENEQISYRFARQQAIQTDNQRALQQLTAIGPPPYRSYKDMLVERAWVERFGGGKRAQRYSDSSFGTDERAVLSLALPFLDTLDWLQGPSFSLKNLWDELQTVNLFQQVPLLEVPVYFLEGRHDYYTPSIIAQRYYDVLDAPQGKTLIWFEESAHLPPSEEPEKFYNILVNRILKETHH